MFPNAYGLKGKIPKQRILITEEGKISVTNPGKETTLEEAIRRYSVDQFAGTRAYYEQEGLELPRLEKMDRLEQLMFLAEVREDMQNKRNKAEQIVGEMEKKQREREIEKEVAKKVGESKQKNNEGTHTV